jgi:hypothetical protein
MRRNLQRSGGGRGDGHAGAGRPSFAWRTDLARRADPHRHWPEGMLSILDWGCAMNACVDCHHDDAQVLLYEPDDGW